MTTVIIHSVRWADVTGVHGAVTATTDQSIAIRKRTDVGEAIGDILRVSGRRYHLWRLVGEYGSLEINDIHRPPTLYASDRSMAQTGGWQFLTSDAERAVGMNASGG